MPRSPVILHADMDAFYASVEQRDRPELRGRPVVVGGKPPRGVVSAASYEARRFGVHSAMPAIEAQRRCPEAVFLSGDLGKYGRVSKQIRAVFEEFSPDIEPLSLDEAFIDITSTMRALRADSPLEVGERLKARVMEDVGLVVSVGIGPVKMVAKIASDLSKPDGLLEVPAGEVRSFLKPLPISRLWGVGAVTEEKLRLRGILTIGDLAQIEDRAVPTGLRRLWHLAQGDDVRTIERDRDARSYGEENTFAIDVEDDQILGDVIGQHAEAVARRLRRDEVLARVVRLKVKSTEKLERPGGYRSYTRQLTLPEATDDGATLAEAARALLRDGELPRPIRLVGVTAAGIQQVEQGGGRQLSIFDAPRKHELNEALDKIADRHGKDAVRRGAGGVVRASLTSQIKRGD
ncbi:MAG: DNA polymerase IV [Candidatus Binatia bacterium]|nr:DNA polymerase IV [Candidatus Binatia bacterium]